jgi:hypothetical protein
MIFLRFGEFVTSEVSRIHTVYPRTILAWMPNQQTFDNVPRDLSLRSELDPKIDFGPCFYVKTVLDGNRGCPAPRSHIVQFEMVKGRVP